MKKGKQKDSLSASTWRNIAAMFPRIIFYGILALVINVFNIGFIITSLCLFAIILINSLIIIIRQKEKTFV